MFIKSQDQILHVTTKTVSSTPGKTWTVIKGTEQCGRSVLFNLTEVEAVAAVNFLNSELGISLSQQIQSRLLWADHEHQGLDKLIKPSFVHGGITQQQNSDPLSLKFENGRIEQVVSH